MLFLQPYLFCLKFLNLFIEFGYQPVLVSQFLLCLGKVSLAEPREDGVPAFLRLLHIGLQLGYILFILDYLLPVIFRVNLMLGGRTDNSTLQPERFHGLGIAVLVFMQFGTTHHVIRRQTGSGLRFIFLFALPLPADTLTGYNGYDCGVQVWGLLVHMQHAGHKVVITKGFL